ncbi:MAG: 6-phosphofructokinase [Eubacteriales bacterium]|jgi:6-phosphofructokinase
MAKRRVGILTSGGDCPGLNAVMRAIAKTLYEMYDDVEILGIEDGYKGLIEGRARVMKPCDFSGILTLGGTVLGTKRTPFKMMEVIEEDGVDKVAAMKANYKKWELDCLFTLGGNGTHKTANLLSQNGLNIIGLPKTIDNDIFGTDVTFGFHTALDIATESLDRIHTTACSHGRVMVVEVMGNKAGWLTLYAGIAGGADVLLIPEIPYDIEKVAKVVKKRQKQGKRFTIVAVAEGVISVEEAKMKKKEREEKRRAEGIVFASPRITRQLQEMTGQETRLVTLGHIQRGGSPSAYDRLLCTKFGVYAAQLYASRIFGVTVAEKQNTITHNHLSDIAGIPKQVPITDEAILMAKKMGICFGD